MKTFSNIFYFILLCILVFVRCTGDKSSVSVFPEVIHPMDNQSTEAKIALGKRLFFDKRLSLNNEISCASCHQSKLALSDGKSIASGVEGRQAFRNTPSLYNVAYAPRLMYDGEIKFLEEQVLVPILDHDEMGASMGVIIKKLKAIPEYQDAAKEVFGRDFDAWVLTRSIACYERTLISDNSNFDRYYFKKEEGAISESAKRGWKLFSEKLKCTECHALPYFTDFKMHNNGRTSMNSVDLGRFRINNDSTEIGFFKTPSLRNSGLTAPYMHDGSLETLDDVIDYYSKGGGHGIRQEGNIKPFVLQQNEKNDLKNFLKSLDDY